MPDVVSVIDDDLSVRRAVARLIASAGFGAEVFASAQEYLDATHDQGVACLILEVHLGGMSGIELAEKLEAGGEAPPVIFITAHDDEATRERARKCGATGYLRKPFDGTSLLQMISDALARKDGAPGPLVS
ncbi:MAG TPA: response regulator [Blastocatellia bacterium]|nr:response regulator [Blastocatellia bacterium]